MRLAFPGLSTALAEGATVILPSATLASAAHEQYTNEQIQSRRLGWERPQIFSIDAWMATCWHQLRYSERDTPLLLSPSQEHELWRSVIEHFHPDLFDIRAMASLAQRASRVVAEYEIPCDKDRWCDYPDAREFLTWHREVQRRLQSENWITRADLWRLTSKWILHGDVQPKKVIFATVRKPSPGLSTLLRAVDDESSYLKLSSQNAAAIVQERGFTRYEEQFDHVARAARQLLDSGTASSIGIVVADLHAHSRELVHKFREIFYPSSGGGHQDAIHFTTGRLIDAPVVANAILLLELLQPRIGYASAGAMLRCPVISGAQDERSARGVAWQKLQKARELDFSSAEIVRAVKDCPILLRSFQALGKLLPKIPASMRLPEWSSLFSQVLKAFDWPSIPDPSVQEQKAIDAFQDSLSQLAALGLVAGQVSSTAAVSHLRSLLSRPIAEGDWSSSVQILAAGEAEGIEFDRTFVLNASDDIWPEPIPALPLVPYHLQRAYGVPGSSPQSLKDEQERTTGALVRSAPEVRVLYNEKVAPAFRSYVQGTACDAEWSGKTSLQAQSPAKLETLNDEQAPSLPPGKVPGGAGVIKSQSLCPFRAFAEYRLRARGQETASFGFDALERGTFLHKALEHVWRELQTQDKLKSLSQPDLGSLIEECVTRAVHDDGSGPIRTVITAAERERIRNVITHWLQIEKQRLHPFKVELLESEKEVDFADLKLRLRVDRIDRLKDGSVLLIDYKSGEQTKDKLLGERPREPQLLVYAASIGEPVEGLVLAELRNRGPRAVGHTSGKHFSDAKTVKPYGNEWERFLEDGRGAVDRLAREFVSGVAAVSPGKGACEFCDMEPLCRIQSVGDGAAEEE